MRVYGRWMLSAIMAAAVTLGGCNEGIKTSDLDIKQVQYKELREMMASNKKGPTVLLDPRSPRRYEQGHLPGSINIPLPQIVAGHPELAEAKNIVVYGSGWTDYHSPAAAKRLMALGYKNVRDFRGGVELWRSEGAQVLTTVVENQEGEAEGGAGSSQPAADQR